jgi:hypothetical protein
VPALEESVHFHVRSSALSFDRFANDYAVSKQFAPEPEGPPRRGAWPPVFHQASLSWSRLPDLHLPSVEVFMPSSSPGESTTTD